MRFDFMESLLGEKLSPSDKYEKFYNIINRYLHTGKRVETFLFRIDFCLSFTRNINHFEYLCIKVKWWKGISKWLQQSLVKDKHTSIKFEVSKHAKYNTAPSRFPLIIAECPCELNVQDLTKFSFKGPQPEVSNYG